MIISIDYDDTYTNDPDLWDRFIAVAESKGHIVICVTARRDTFENRREMTIPVETILFAYDCPKRQYAEYKGYHVDVWIDDKPEAIV